MAGAAGVVVFCLHWGSVGEGRLVEVGWPLPVLCVGCVLATVVGCLCISVVLGGSACLGCWPRVAVLAVWGRLRCGCIVCLRMSVVVGVLWRGQNRCCWCVVLWWAVVEVVLVCWGLLLLRWLPGPAGHVLSMSVCLLWRFRHSGARIWPICLRSFLEACKNRPGLHPAYAPASSAASGADANQSMTSNAKKCELRAAPP